MRAAGERSANPLALILGAITGWLVALDARVAFAALAAAAGVVLVYIGAEALLLGLVGTEPWADALAFPTATFTVPKIVGLLAVGSWALAAATGRASLRYTAQIGWALLFLLAVLLSLMVSSDSGAGTSKTVSYALYVTFLALFVQLIHRRAGVNRCLAIYVASATVAGGVGLIEFLTGQVGRTAGPIADANDFAFLLAGAIPVAVYFAFNAASRRWLWWVAVAVLAGATATTLSRGAIVGFAAVVLWAIVSRRISVPGAFGAAVAIAGVLGVLLVFFQPLVQERLVQKSVIADKNVASRVVFWSAAWRISMDHPVFGVGPGRFGTVSQRYVLNDPIVLQDPVVHNSYLEILSEDGPLALALFLCFLGSVWRALGRLRGLAARRGDLDGGRLVDALKASFVWTFVSALFVSRQLSIPFWLLGGLTGSLAVAWSEELYFVRQLPGLPPRLLPRNLRAGG